MRLVSFIFAFCFQALAFGAVGEWAHLSGTATKEPCSPAQKFETRYTVISENTQHNSMSVQVEKNFAGEQTSTISSWPLNYTSQFESEFKLRTYCKNMEGQIENITVPAGTFLSCKVSDKSEDGWVTEAWMGAVPLGIIAVKSIKDIFSDPSCAETIDQQLVKFGSQ